MTNLSRILPHHAEIDVRLERWGHWVTTQPKAWSVLPMFAQYRSHAWQWETPLIHINGTPAENWQIEKLVSHLPDKHRTVIRWAYAWPWIPIRAVRQHLGLTVPSLLSLLDDGRDMLINRMRR